MEDAISTATWRERFDSFFQGKAAECLMEAVRLALDEDGRDLTSLAIFPEEVRAEAVIAAKEEAVVAGLPLAEIVLGEVDPSGSWIVEYPVGDGDRLAPGQTAIRLCGTALCLLKAERVILNFICRLSGIATLTSRYASELAGTRTRLLDTRKTSPGLRYPEKYAVLAGGGLNHRLNLEEMLMLKDTHLDRAGSMEEAVASLRRAYSPCPPIEVEARDLEEVKRAVALGVERIMFDNMDPPTMKLALGLIPQGIETEASGGVNLENIKQIGEIGPDFVSVGRLTHSARAADFHMRIIRG